MSQEHKDTIQQLIARNQFETALGRCLQLESQLGSTADLATTIGDLYLCVRQPTNAAHSYINAYRQASRRRPIEGLCRALGMISLDVMRQQDSLIQSTVKTLRHAIVERGANGLELLGLLLSGLNFTRMNAIENNRGWFELLLVPILKMLSAIKQYHNLLALEEIIYDRMVKQDEQESTFAYMMQSVAPIMHSAGQTYRRSQQLPVIKHIPNERPRVGFFLHNASVLAHIQVLFSFLQGWTELGKRDIEPIVYLMEGQNAEMESVFRSYNVEFIYIQQFSQSKDYVKNLMCLRELISRTNVSVIVWVSLGLRLPFASGLRIAPKQVWWTMKYRTMETPDIDAYVATTLRSADPFVKEDWYEGFCCINRPRTPVNLQDVQRLRSQFPPNTVILGTMAREELINRPKFLSNVCDILDRHRNCVYLWTGRKQDPEIENYFKKRKLSHQQFFIGWVDVLFYAEVLDIFLDTFPFGCGLNLVHTMAAEKAVVFCPHGGTNYFHVVSSLMEKFAERMGKNEVQFWQTLTELCQDYLGFARLLIEDEQYRRQAAAFNKRIVEKLFYNHALSAEMSIDAFRRIALS